MATFTIFDKQVGGGTGTISIGLAGEATEIWELHADSIDVTTEDCRQSGLLPEPYTTSHLQNSRLLLMPIEITQDEECPWRFICTLKWTSEPLNPQDVEEQNDNPLDRKARIRVKTIRENEVKHRDKYGKKKLNAAGDLFDPPIESNTAYLQIIIRKNVTVLPDWAFDFIDCVNSVPFTIKGRTFPAKRVCVADIDLGEEKEDGGTPYSEAVVELHVKKPRLPLAGEVPEDVPSPWQTEQLNEGLHELYNEGGVVKRRRISVPSVDENGLTTQQPAACPVLLDDDGKKLNPVNVDNATYEVFDDHEYKDFNDIAAYLWSYA